MVKVDSTRVKPRQSSKAALSSQTSGNSKDNSNPGADVSRRDFIRTTAVVTGALAVPLIVPSRVVRGADAPSKRILVGQIGCGRIGTDHDMPGVIKSGLADYIACCDLDSVRAANGKTFIQTTRKASSPLASSPAPDITVFGKYEDLLARKDIDAVVISLPDHQHAQVCLAAIRAGKDVYLQKPFTMTMEEGIMLRDAIVKSGRIFQIGSQQRSWGPNEQFRHAVEFVRGGRVGNLTHVELGLPIDPTAPDDPKQAVPANLNYDRWLGPTAEAYYTEQRVHPQANVKDRPGWLRNESYCLGMITGWGAHHFDTAHWGMDMELTGPSRVEGTADFPPPDHTIWNVHGAYHIELQYPKGIKMTVTDKFPNGIRFIGDEGWIFVSRDGQVSSSDPTNPTATDLKPLDASNPKLLDPAGLKVQLKPSTEHHLNWLQSVVSRQHDNLAPAPIAMRSTAACIVSWIAMKLKRPLNWDAQKERFVNDDEANAMLSRPERGPYGAIHASKA